MCRRPTGKSFLCDTNMRCAGVLKCRKLQRICIAIVLYRDCISITSLPSLQTAFADRTTTHISGNSSIDTSLICDIYCGPEVLFENCVAMKFVDDDDVLYSFRIHVLLPG